jgi:hypothetical protein
MIKNIHHTNGSAQPDNEHCCPGNAPGRKVHSNITYYNPVIAPMNQEFAITSIVLPAGTWDVRGIANVFLSASPGNSQGIGLTSGIQSLAPDGYSCYHSSVFSNDTFLECSLPGCRVTLSQTTRVFLLAKTVHPSGSVVKAWGYISAVKQ